MEHVTDRFQVRLHRASIPLLACLPPCRAVLWQRLRAPHHEAVALPRLDQPIADRAVVEGTIAMAWTAADLAVPSFGRA